MADDDAVLVVMVSVPDASVGRKLAELLVKERLVACASRLPGMESTYVWDGRVQTTSEELLILKTTNARWEALVATIRAHHPYQCPEIIATKVESGLASYLDWVRTSIRV